MIYCLTGKIVKKKHERGGAQLRRCRLLCPVPGQRAGALPGVGKEATIYTVMSVTENDVSLTALHRGAAGLLLRCDRRVRRGA